MMKGATWEEGAKARLEEAREKAEYHEKEATYWASLRDALEKVMEREGKLKK